MPKKLEPHDSPGLRLLGAILERDFKTKFGGLTEQLPMEIVTAVYASSIGAVLGYVQGVSEVHAMECEKCAARELDLKEIFLKNFETGFNAYRGNELQQANDAAASADKMLDEIIKRAHK